MNLRGLFNIDPGYMYRYRLFVDILKIVSSFSFGPISNPARYRTYTCLQAVMGAVTIPVIASSGAGAVEHFSQVFEETGVQAVSALFIVFVFLQNVSRILYICTSDLERSRSWRTDCCVDTPPPQPTVGYCLQPIHISFCAFSGDACLTA